MIGKREESIFQKSAKIDYFAFVYIQLSYFIEINIVPNLGLKVNYIAFEKKNVEVGQFFETQIVVGNIGGKEMNMRFAFRHQL